MSFYGMPNPWNPGYAIPDYVMAEPPERGTFTTQWLPRGTIPALVPDMLAKPGKKLLGRADAGLGSLGGTTLSKTVFSESSLMGSSLGDDPIAPPSTDAGPAVKVTNPMTGMSRNQKIALGVGVAAVAYLLLKKRGRR